MLGVVRRRRAAPRAAATCCASGDTSIWIDCGNGTFGHLQEHIDGRGPHRGRAHPRAPRPLRRHLRPARATCATASGIENLPVLRAGGAREVPAVAGRPTGATRSTGARSATATPPRSATSTCASRRTDHPPPTYAVEATARRPAHDLHRRHRARSGRVGAFDPGADLVLSEATYLHDNMPAADPPVGQAGRRGRARGAGAAADPHPPLAADRPAGAVAEGSRGVRRAGHPRRAGPRHRRSDAASHRCRKTIRWESDATGASPTSCGRSRSRATSPSSPPGSVLVEFGRTRVLCTASVEERVPPWLRGKGRGWVTAEYSMLPGLHVGAQRPRGGAKGKQSGRTQEIQRLIGRSLRAVTDLADDGRGADHRRLRRAAGRRRHAHRVDLRRLRRAARRVLAPRRSRARWRAHPLTDQCAAISVGIVDALPYLDLDYSEDVAGRGRHERRDDRRRPVRRGAGHRRGRAVLARASSTTCSAWPRRASARSSTLQRELLAVPPAPRRRDRCREARPRDREPRQGARRSRDVLARRRRSTSSSCPGPTTCPRSTRPAPRSRRTRGSKAVALCDATGLPAIADDTGLEVDALGGAPGVLLGALRGRGRDLRRQRARSCSSALARRRPDRRAPPASPRSRSPAGPTAGRSPRSATVEGDDRHRRRGATAASATTRCSSRSRATGARSPR